MSHRTYTNALENISNFWFNVCISSRHSNLMVVEETLQRIWWAPKMMGFCTSSSCLLHSGNEITVLQIKPYKQFEWSEAGYLKKYELSNIYLIQNIIKLYLSKLFEKPRLLLASTPDFLFWYFELWFLAVCTKTGVSPFG